MPIYDRFGGVYGSAQPVIEVPSIPTLRLDARSCSLLNADWRTQADVPGMLLPIPTSDAEAVALGWPSVAAAVDGDIWTCDEAAGNLVGKVRGYQLAPNGGALQNREFVGAPYGTSFNAKKCVEGTSGSIRFAQTPAGGRVGTQDFTISVLLRNVSYIPAVAERILTARGGGLGWELWATQGVAGSILWMQDATSNTARQGPVVPSDGSPHLLTVSVARAGNTSFYLDGAVSVVLASVRPLTLDDGVAAFCVGSPNGFGFFGQTAWVYYNIGTAATRTGHDALWRAFKTSAFNTPSIYTRTTPMRCAITANRVAAYGAGQVGVGFDAGAVDAPGGNALGTGVLMEEGAVFQNINSVALAAWGTGGNTSAAADGADEMRSGLLVTQKVGNWAVPAPSYIYGNAGTPGAGTNVPWVVGGEYKRSTVGTTARVNVLFQGDPGGAEEFAVLSDDAAPVDWKHFFAVSTPTRAAHTAANVLLGAKLVNDNCVYSDIYQVKNRAVDIAARILVGTVSVSTTATPHWHVDNTGNIRYNPARGAYTIDFSGFPGVNATFLGFGAALAAGTMILDYAAANLRLRIYDSAGALVDTVLGGALGTGRYSVTVLWDAYTPLPLNGAPGQHMALCSGNVVLGASAVAWTPALAGPGTLHIGTLDDGSLPARCIIY